MNNQLILVDSRDNILGYDTKENCHKGEGKTHRAYSIFIINKKDQLLIQKRSKQKLLWNGYWANSCCSHPRKGEDRIKSGERRLTEELGFTTKLKLLFKYKYHAKYKNIGSENEFNAVLVGIYNDEKITPNPEEIEEYKWVDLKWLQKDMKKNHKIYAPWFLIAFKKFINIYK